MNSRYSYPYMEEWKETGFLSGNDLFDEDRFIHSAAGRDLARARSLMNRYSATDDERLEDFWEQKGVRSQTFHDGGHTWLRFLPLDALRAGSQTWPVLLVFRPADLLAEAFYCHMIELAAQGEMILCIYSSEDLADNEFMEQILLDTLKNTPADPSRVYVTGHSHYGEFARHFAMNHPEQIAALAQQGDAPGYLPDFYGSSQEELEKMHRTDLPLLIITGTTEFNSCFPINADAPGIPENSPFRHSSFPMTKKDRILAWKRRLYAENCRVPEEEETGSEGTPTRAEKELGVRADRSRLFYADGSEYYIAEFKNQDGKWHFTLAGAENIPHTTVTFFHTFSWSFLRRFSRNQETGEITEA